jgi:hypothetical protein
MLPVATAFGSFFGLITEVTTSTTLSITVCTGFGVEVITITPPPVTAGADELDEVLDAVELELVLDSDELEELEDSELVDDSLEDDSLELDDSVLDSEDKDDSDELEDDTSCAVVVMPATVNVSRLRAIMNLVILCCYKNSS